MGVGDVKLDRQQLLDQISGFEEAAALDRAERRRCGPQSARSIATSLDLFELSALRHGWPVRVDPVREREVAAAREAWRRVLGRLGVE